MCVSADAAKLRRCRWRALSIAQPGCSANTQPEEQGLLVGAVYEHNRGHTFRVHLQYLGGQVIDGRGVGEVAGQAAA